LEAIYNKLKNMGYIVIYGDTDSVFVHKPTQEQIDYLIDFCKKHYSIDLEIDKEYKYLVLSDRKKNYFGVKKDGSLDIKGLSGKKSNTPPFVKRLFNDVLEKIKPIENMSDFYEVKQEVRYVIKNVIDNFDNIPLDQLSFKVMIAKDPSEYKMKPQAVKAGEQLGDVQKGQFVEFVKTWQASESRQQVADQLEVTYGSIVSREKTLRKHGVNLKVMAKQPRGIQINANALNDLISQIDGTELVSQADGNSLVSQVDG